MKHITFALLSVGAVAGAVVTVSPYRDNRTAGLRRSMELKLPQGYRDWRPILVARLAAGKSDQALVDARMARKQLRAQLGNDIAIKAFREGKLPFPDGAIIAALHWNEVSSDENDKVLAIGFPGAGLDFSVPDVRCERSIHGQGLKQSTPQPAAGDLPTSRTADPAMRRCHKTCFPCHQPAKDHDYVFTHYAPAP